MYFVCCAVFTYFYVGSTAIIIYNDVACIIRIINNKFAIVKQINLRRIISIARQMNLGIAANVQNGAFDSV